MSVLVHDPKRGNKKFTLYVRGDDKAMKNTLDLNTKGRQVYKQLMMNYKMKGLKNIVLGRKDLSTTDIQNFVANYRVVSKMTRGQEENFNKLANELEVGLEFVGCIGGKEHINKEAKVLTEKLEQAKIQASILTGDNLDNCLMVSDELNLSKFNLNDSS